MLTAIAEHDLHFELNCCMRKCFTPVGVLESLFSHLNVHALYTVFWMFFMNKFEHAVAH